MAQPQPPNIAQYGVFKVQNLIESTHMSQTWLAQKRESDKQGPSQPVVIKVALRDRTDGTEQFRTNQDAITNEEAWLRKLQGQETHPAIVQLVPITHTPGGPIYSAKTQDPGQPWFIVLDFLPGGSLRDLLKAQQMLAVHIAVRVAYHIAQALAYVHQKGCVHLDIKPDNIMFRAKFDPSRATVIQPVLIDFGIARPSGQTHHIGGAAAWMAPEALRARENRTPLPIQPELDIYPLGLLLHSMITGRHPREEQVQAGNQLSPITPALIKSDQTIPARQRELFAQRLTELIRQMTDPAAHKRPNATAVIRELEDLMHLAPREQKQAQAARSGWSLNLAMGATVVALICLLLFWSIGGQGGPPTATVTPTPVATLPDLPTIAAGLVSTATSISAPTATPSATLVPATATATTTTAPTPVVPTATLVPTNTPLLTATPLRLTPSLTPSRPATATRLATATPLPTASATATVVPLPVNLPTRATPAAPAAPRRVTLLEPADGSAHSGTVRFAWEANFTLNSNEGFEVAIWPVGQEQSTAYGLHNAGNFLAIEINLQRYSENTPDRLRNGQPYHWAVRVWSGNTYRWVSEPRTFTYSGN